MPRNKTIARTYGECMDLLRGKDERRVALNTTIRKVDGFVLVVRFYATDIIRFYPDGTKIVNAGGYRSVTTKRRFNEFGIGVYQKDHEWYIGDKEFEDGMTLPAAAVTVG